MNTKLTKKKLTELKKYNEVTVNQMFAILSHIGKVIYPHANKIIIKQTKFNNKACFDLDVFENQYRFLNGFISEIKIAGMDVFGQKNNSYFYQSKTKNLSELRANYAKARNAHKIFRRRFISYFLKVFYQQYIYQIPYVNRPLVFDYSNGSTHINLLKLHKLINNKTKSLAIVSELRADNLLHLIDICFFYQLRPQELKKQLSKFTWEKITHNAKSKNKIILSIIMRFPDAQINILAQLPTSVLNSYSRLYRNFGKSDSLNAFLCFCIKQNYKPKDYFKNAYTILETIALADGHQFLLNFNSIKDISKHHDDLFKKWTNKYEHEQMLKAK